MQYRMRDFSHHSDKEQIQSFCKRLHHIQLEYSGCFSDGSMIRPLNWSCPETDIELNEGLKPLQEKSVLSCAWATPENRKLQFFINYTTQPVKVDVEEQSFIVSALDVAIMDMDNQTII